MDEQKELKELKEVKVGWKTSEFWVMILTQIGSISASLAGFVDPKIATILMAISGTAYTISRGWAKI